MDDRIWVGLGANGETLPQTDAWKWVEVARKRLDLLLVEIQAGENLKVEAELLNAVLALIGDRPIELPWRPIKRRTKRAEAA